MDYLNNTWSPVPNVILKNEDFRADINKSGYFITKMAGNDILNRLRVLFEEYHHIEDKRGGVFYSVYSSDVEYRKKIHFGIIEILQPILDKFCSGYRIALGSFVIKYPGPESEFALHQDGTGVDEFKYSPLNVWIPLDDVDRTNGAMALVPCSHRFFSPFRHISFPTPFQNIQEAIWPYLKVIELEKEEAIIFDNRLIHNSLVNKSDKPRIAVVCGLVPEDAPLMICHKPQFEYYNKVELIQQDDEFLWKHPNFLIDCHVRPEMGQSLGWATDEYGEITVEDFVKLCERSGVSPIDEVKHERTNTLNLIGEPDYVHYSKQENNRFGHFITRIKRILS